LELGASFVSLYDHPDKYLPPSQGGNPYCEGGAEDTRVYLTKSTHWKITNSTTMTFAATVSTLKKNRRNSPEVYSRKLSRGF
jgi:outer membrane scaffolding protein for murein synthesis (MipA/OmpV family)